MPKPKRRDVAELIVDGYRVRISDAQYTESTKDGKYFWAIDAMVEVPHYLLMDDQCTVRMRLADDKVVLVGAALVTRASESTLSLNGWWKLNPST